PLPILLVIMVIGFTLIPINPSMDIRGWSEMHPLNGPAWSLFFEYIANILYALFIRKFSNRVLSILVFIAGCALIQMAITSSTGDVVGGWSLDQTQLRIGFTRLLYPFFAGLLLSRVCKPGRIKNAFLWSSLLVVVTLSMPRIGGYENLWMNGLYDSLSIIILFPLIVYIGASGKVNGKFGRKICKFLGDISYPIYITHFPMIYIFTGWVVDNNVSMLEAWSMAAFVFFASIVIAYASLKLYDVPVRTWLAKRFLKKTNA